MDTGSGTFKHFENELQLNKEVERLRDFAGSFFRIGEIVEIKKSKFKIRSIGKREMRLQLMKL